VARHFLRSTDGATKPREPGKTEAGVKGLNKRDEHQQMTIRRYRTQEVAVSSPASSIQNGVQTSEKAVRAEADAGAKMAIDLRDRRVADARFSKRLDLSGSGLAALNLEAVCHRCLRLERIGDDDREAERP
jgi:hypothetical protein